MKTQQEYNYEINDLRKEVDELKKKIASLNPEINVKKNIFLAGYKACEKGWNIQKAENWFDKTYSDLCSGSQEETEKIIKDLSGEPIPGVKTNIDKAVDLLYKVYPVILCGIKDKSITNEIREFLFSLLDRNKLNIERDALIRIYDICKNTDELNMSNYTIDQISALNQAMIEIYQISEPFIN